MNYLTPRLIYFEIYVTAAMSLNLLIGYGGLSQVGEAEPAGVKRREACPGKAGATLMMVWRF